MSPPVVKDRAPPESVADARASAWSWAVFLLKGADGALKAAKAAEGTPDVYAKADEAVRMLDAVTAAARIARDSLPRENGSPQDQMGWFKVATSELMASMRDHNKATQAQWERLPGTVARLLEDGKKK